MGGSGGSVDIYRNCALPQQTEDTVSNRKALSEVCTYSEFFHKINFSQIFFLIRKADLQRKEAKKERHPYMVTTAGLEPIQSLFQVSHIGANSQGFEPSFTVQGQGHNQGAGWKAQQQRTNQYLYGMLALLDRESAT